MDSNLQVFVSTVVAIFLGASPFLLLGAFLAAVMEVYLPEDKIRRYLPTRKLTGLLFGLFAGMLVPTCECGVVSVVRRFLRRDVPPHVAMTYLFAAPVINPLVLVATYTAFQGNVWMVLGRVGIVAVCALSMGWILSYRDPALFLRRTDETLPVHGMHDHSHDHDHAGDGQASPFIRLIVHAAGEFMDLGKYVVLGGVIVALLRILLPADLLLLFQGSTALSVGALMVLAILVSVCSEADAFLAAGFATFPAVARLSFVSIGPMVDMKLIFMYGAVFRTRVAVALVVGPVILVYALSNLLGMVLK